MQPWSRLFLSTAIDHLIKDASGGGTTSEREPGPVPCEDMLREDGQTISLHSFILVPMPPNCHHTKGWLQPFNPLWNWWLSQHLPSFCIPWCQPWPFNGPFWNSVWQLVSFPSAATVKWLASTFSTHHEVGDWASICHPFAFLDASPGVSMGHFGIVCGYLYVPSAATIKWLAWTFQPTMKLVVGPAPAILWGWNCRGSWVFNPITHLKLVWWVEASHLIMAGFGKLCK